MKWISNLNRQSILPILFGISLTTFGLSVAILLYNMFEQVKFVCPWHKISLYCIFSITNNLSLKFICFSNISLLIFGKQILINIPPIPLYLLIFHCRMIWMMIVIRERNIIRWQHPNAKKCLCQFKYPRSMYLL